jgi:hypothetical protein
VSVRTACRSKYRACAGPSWCVARGKNEGAAQADLAPSYGVSQATISRLWLRLALSTQGRAAALL